MPRPHSDTRLPCLSKWKMPCVGWSICPKLAAHSHAGVLRAGVPHAGVSQAGVLHAGVFHAGVLRAGVFHADVVRAGVLREGVLCAGVLRAGVLCAGVLHAGALHADVSQAGVLHAGMLCAAMFRAGVLHAGVLHAGVLLKHVVETVSPPPWGQAEGGPLVVKGSGDRPDSQGPFRLCPGLCHRLVLREGWPPAGRAGNQYPRPRWWRPRWHGRAKGRNVGPWLLLGCLGGGGLGVLQRADAPAMALGRTGSLRCRNWALPGQQGARRTVAQGQSGQPGRHLPQPLRAPRFCAPRTGVPGPVQTRAAPRLPARPDKVSSISHLASKHSHDPSD